MVNVIFVCKLIFMSYKRLALAVLHINEIEFDEPPSNNGSDSAFVQG